jgi:Fic family protein
MFVDAMALKNNEPEARKRLAGGEPSGAILRSQIVPKDNSERMILNNYLTMREIEQWKNQKLTPELIFEIHRKITENTLDDSTAAGRLRRADELVEVVDEQTEEVLHVPPPACTLEKRMQAMCDFANQSDDSSPFVHPVIRGVILHFWLAYDHPFKDGNGRTARALFYWLMLNRGFGCFNLYPSPRSFCAHARATGRPFSRLKPMAMT